MQLTTTPVLHRVLTVNSSQRTSTAIAIVLGVLLVSFATFHVMTDELILHSASFVVSVTVIGIRTMQLIKLRTEPGSAARRQIWSIVKFGAGMFIPPSPLVLY
jgi:dihydroceramidase